MAFVPPFSHSVAWSADGSKLAFVQGNPDFANPNLLGNVAPSSIWVVQADGGEPVQVTDQTSLNVSPTWLPDGNHLLFVSNREGPRDAYVMRVDGSGRPRGEAVRVTTGLDPHSMSVSADGTTIAYSRFTFRRNIWEMPLPTTGTASISEARRVTVGNQVIESHARSNDGEWLVFDSNLEGISDR